MGLKAKKKYLLETGVRLEKSGTPKTVERPTRMERMKRGGRQKNCERPTK